MAVAITHKFVSAKADGVDNTLVQPSNWNDTHTLSLTSGRLVGRTTAGVGDAEEISVSAELSLVGTVLSITAGGITTAMIGDAQVTPAKASAVTGTGNFVLSDSPTFTGTATFNTISATANISDGKGNVRDNPVEAVAAAYTLVATDKGKVKNAAGGVTVPSGVFAAGESVTVFNNTAGNITITQGVGVTMYQGGTANTGNRTLAQRGVVSIICVAANTFVICGAGLT